MTCNILINTLYLKIAGEFADVCRGKMTLPNNTTIDVAVKQLKKGASAKDQMNFLREASTMAQFNHPNIISLKGVIIKSKELLFVFPKKFYFIDRFAKL